MSGGFFDYRDLSLKDEIFSTGECCNVFEDLEISELVFDTLDLIHEFDWYKSGDTDEQDYLEAKIRFKEKWLGSVREELVKKNIDEAIERAKYELYQTYRV